MGSSESSRLKNDPSEKQFMVRLLEAYDHGKADGVSEAACLLDKNRTEAYLTCGTAGALLFLLYHATFTGKMNRRLKAYEDLLREQLQRQPPAAAAATERPAPLHLPESPNGDSSCKRRFGDETDTRMATELQKLVEEGYILQEKHQIVEQQAHNLLSASPKEKPDPTTLRALCEMQRRAMQQQRQFIGRLVATQNSPASGSAFQTRIFSPRAVRWCGGFSLIALAAWMVADYPTWSSFAGPSAPDPCDT